MAAIDLLRQHSDMFDGSGFGKSIERGVDKERIDELHVDNGVCKHRDETVDERHEEQEFETGYIVG